MIRRRPRVLLLGALLVALLLLGSCSPESATKISYRYFPTTAQR